MDRPSSIDVHAVGGEVRVGGRVAACAEGRFTLPSLAPAVGEGGPAD